MKVLIPFYSLYGHIYTLAQAVAEGVKAAGGEPKIARVAETLSPELVKRLGAAPDDKRGADLPQVTTDDMVEAGAIIFGSPTRFGGMCAQMRAFLDSTGGLWAQGKLVGKIGGAFTSTGTQHGGQEATLLGFHVYMLHHGMLVGGVPFTYPGLSITDQMTGGSPYGAGAVAGPASDLAVTDNEKGIARRQGEFLTGLALRLAY